MSQILSIYYKISTAFRLICNNFDNICSICAKFAASLKIDRNCGNKPPFSPINISLTIIHTSLTKPQPPVTYLCFVAGTGSKSTSSTFLIFHYSPFYQLMKKSFFLFASLVLGVTFGSVAQNIALHASASTPKGIAKALTIQWKEITHQFGEIKQAVPATVAFEFKNVSNEPVLLTQVQGSCGCTATAYSKEAIQPGQTSRITATYNAANLGTFHKTVTVTTSADKDPHTLTLQGTVVR